MVEERPGGVHFAVALAADRLPLIGAPAPLRGEVDRRTELGASSEASPDERMEYVRTVSYAWYGFAFVAGLAMVLLAYLGHVVAGNGGRTSGLAIGAGVGFFCATGGVYATWRTVWAVLARSRARRYGLDDPRYLRAMERTALHDSSLVLQALVGVIAFYLVLTRT